MIGYWIRVQQIIFAPGENFLRRFKNRRKVLFLCLTGPSVTYGVGNGEGQNVRWSGTHLGWYGVCPKAKEESDIFELVRLQGLQVLYCRRAMKIRRGCMVVMKGEKCEDLYHLVGNTIGKPRSLRYL